MKKLTIPTHRFPSIPSRCGRSRDNVPRSLRCLLRLLPLPQGALPPLRTIRLVGLPFGRRSHRTTYFVLHFLFSLRHAVALQHEHHNICLGIRVSNTHISTAALSRGRRYDWRPWLCRRINLDPLDRNSRPPPAIRKLLLHILLAHLNTCFIPLNIYSAQNFYLLAFFTLFYSLIRTPQQHQAVDTPLVPRNLRVCHAISTHERSSRRRQDGGCKSYEYDIYKHAVCTCIR